MTLPLANLGLDIVCAKVATEKSDALDVFYVTDSAGAKLAETAQRAAEAAISEQLLAGGEGPVAPATSQPLRRHG